MPNCAIKLCRNYKNKRNINNTVTYHLFPTDPVLAERWIEEVRCSRNEYWWKPNPHTTICSAHFLNKDKYVTKGGRRYIKRDAIPSREIDPTKMEPNILEEALNRANIISDTKNDIPVVSGYSSTSMSPSTNLVEDNYRNQSVKTPTVEVDNDVNTSDVESVLDSPRKVKLKTKILKMTKMQQKHAHKIKILKQQNRRLKKRNYSLRNIIKQLKQQLNDKA